MATEMGVNKSSWRDVTEAELAATGKVKRPVPGNATPQQVLKASTWPPERSKYRNVKVVVDGITFDSQREAAYWVGLQVRERAGEIEQLKRQVKLPLLAPDRIHGNDVIVAHYVADFYYETVADGLAHIVDAKGVRTQMYRLKCRWLELQDGIIIEEV